LFDDPEPAGPAPEAVVDAGIDAALASTSPTPTIPPPITPPSSAQAACPPGFVPYTAIEIPQGGVIPCVPAGTPIPASGTSQAAPPPATAATPPAPAPAPAPAPVAAAGNKTLERQAVDFAATGDFARAAAVYEQ